MGQSAKDISTLELVNKNKVRSAAKVVVDVRYKCVGHWPAHMRKIEGVNYALQPKQG